MKAIFVVGTGRSGTHFTCRALGGFTNVVDPHKGEELPSVLFPIARAAIHHGAYPEVATEYYTKTAAELDPGTVLLDQHHPNLFFHAELERIFGDILFVFPERDILQTVSSMLAKPGVMAWYKYVKEKRGSSDPAEAVSYPNQFLGLESDKDLDRLPLHVLCAHRVISHRRKMIELSKTTDNLRILPYADLVADQDAAFKSIFTPEELERLGPFTVAEKSKPASLKKYKKSLNWLQRRQICAVEKASGL